jgi:hypothetical protein
MPKKCDKCGEGFYPGEINVCQTCGESFCDECCSPNPDDLVNVGEICPICNGRTEVYHKEDDIDVEDNG